MRLGHSLEGLLLSQGWWVITHEKTETGQRGQG